SSCMTIENWNASGMGAWAHKQVEGGAECNLCHGAGGWKVDTNVNSDEMFRRNRLQTFVFAFFTTDGKTVLTATPKLEAKGNGEDTHPTFQVQDAYFANLDQFFQLTDARRVAGQCGPPGFPAPQN